ncbi:hypothetical protein UlMin_024244 [Ulmus minor]
MAVAENAPKFDDSVVSSGPDGNNDLGNQEPRNDSDQNSQGKFQNQEKAGRPTALVLPTNHHENQIGQMGNGFEVNDQQMGMSKSGGYGIDQRPNGLGNEGDDIRDLEELLSKLNPMAEEFVPPSLAKSHGYPFGAPFGYANNLLLHLQNAGNANGFNGRKKKNGYTQGRRRNYHKLSPAQREAMIRRTVYVSDIDQQVTEENLAALFLNCGQVVDCRICGDPNSILRFAFVEFTDEDGARTALELSGTMLGYYPVRVLPSKTAIAPVNPTFLPRSDDEREMCSRTIYCTNIDKKVTQADVKLFFESLCGEVQRLRLLGDYHHSTRIAFVEFTVAESAIAALNCSGVVLGTLPIRVSPSKTPVRPRSPRPVLP